MVSFSFLFAVMSSFTLAINSSFDSLSNSWSSATEGGGGNSPPHRGLLTKNSLSSSVTSLMGSGVSMEDPESVLGFVINSWCIFLFVLFVSSSFLFMAFLFPEFGEVGLLTAFVESDGVIL